MLGDLGVARSPELGELPVHAYGDTHGEMRGDAQGETVQAQGALELVG